jgi:RecG-like helicase
VKIAELSRFRIARKDAARRIEGLADGTVDIVVGTHKLLRQDVEASSDLGLLIIDEEHRFGVRHKEAHEGAARRGRRAHAHRHADPAHAGHGAGGPARPVA